MSDYLTRLAERALGLIPAVQPLPATRFAPGTEWSMRREETLNEAQTQPNSPPPDQTEQRVSGPDQQTRPLLASEFPPATPSVHSTMTGSDAGGMSAHSLEAISERHAPLYDVLFYEVLSADRPRGDQRSGDRPPQTAPLSEHLPRLSREPTIPSTTPIRTRRPDTISFAASVPAMPSRTTVPAQYRTLQHPNPPSTSELQETDLFSPTFASRSTDAREKRFDPQGAEQSVRRTADVRPLVTPTAVHQDSSRPAEPTPPVIRVSIGRIEVRVILPPAVERPVNVRNSPTLSLDDFLRRRTEGQH